MKRFFVSLIMLILLLPSISLIPRYVNREEREIIVSGGWRIFGEGRVDIKLPEGTYAYPRFGFNFEASGSWGINTKTLSGGLSGSFSLEYILIYENYTERHHVGGSIEGNVTFQYPAALSDYNSIELSCNIHMYGYEYSKLVCDAFFVSNNVFLQIFPEEGKSDFYWYPSSGYIVLFDCDAIYPPGFAFWDSHGEIWVENVEGFPPPVTEEADFELSVSPDFQSVNPGESVTYIISVTPLNTEISDVFISSEWIGEPPSGAAGVISPTKVTPPATSTLTITTSPETPLGQYTVKIKATSGSITHSVNITLQVGFAVEIEIIKFYLKEDMDEPPTPWLIPFWADVYFNFSVSGVDDDGDGVIDEPDDFYRSPNKGSEPQVRDEYRPGPIYIPNRLLQLPFKITIRAMDSDWGTPDDELGTFDFTVDSIPWQEGAGNSKIFFTISVHELSNRKFYRTHSTNDPYNPEQWYWFEIKANDIFKTYKTTDFKEIVVAVIDSGVDYNHEDLKDVIWENPGEIGIDMYGRDKRTNGVDDDHNGYIDDWRGFDFLAWDSDPMDNGIEIGGQRIYHGTLVAGIIAAKTNNGKGIAGIAPNVKIMPLRVGGIEGSINFPPILDLSNAIRYAKKMGADIICMSLGSYLPPFLTEIEAIKEAYKSGVLIVTASGNDRTSKKFYPAFLEQTLSVSCLARYHVTSNLLNPIYYWSGQDIHSLNLNTTFLALDKYYSNYGPSSENIKKSVEISAPAYGVISTSKNNNYVRASATSFAAPIVAGVAALVLGYAQQKYPDRSLNPAELRYILEASAFDLGPEGWDPYYGYGVVNAYKALQKVDELLGQDSWQIRLDPPANLDLHVYDSLGRHVGLNYETGELEVEIPRAVHTGDETDGFETIFLPANLSEFEIRIIARDINESVTYSLEILLSNETGAIIGEWNFTSEISQGETRYYSVITPIAEKPTIISWEYIFEDTFNRNTTLKISIEDHYFQLITPDKAFSIRNATKMLVICRGIIAIFHRDNELELFAIATTRIDFCFAYAKDIENHKRYLLIDKPRKE